MDSAIKVDDVSKRFKLAHERYQSLKERVVHFGRHAESEEFWALSHVTLDIPKGHTYGLAGHNGSGKSTLLKCIAGILRPTNGEITTVGRMAALLELGAGFHPELTGRENVFLNGSILGLSKREIEARFDEIVAFAELEKFIDMQVRHYSSGMFVRLGFAVAVTVDPEVLLVDEVLAVGDEAFQRKCLDRVRLMQQEGRTIIVVSHSVSLLQGVCDSAAVLDHGNLIFDGPVVEATKILRERLFGPEAFDGDVPTRAVPQGVGDVTEEFRTALKIMKVEFDYRGYDEGTPVHSGDPLTLRIRFAADQRFDDLELVVVMYDGDASRVLYSVDTALLGRPLPAIEGTGAIEVHFDRVPMNEGKFPVSVGFRRAGIVLDWREQVGAFNVVATGPATGVVDLPVAALDVRIDG
jgi:ABC-2 type transport system ATP-binding protein